jgi:hypothetical protein
MNNQHAGLSKALAEQRTTQRHEQAAQTRLVRAVARTAGGGHGWSVAGGGWPGGQGWPETSPSASPRTPVDREAATKDGTSGP